MLGLSFSHLFLSFRIRFSNCSDNLVVFVFHFTSNSELWVIDLLQGFSFQPASQSIKDNLKRDN